LELKERKKERNESSVISSVLAITTIQSPVMHPMAIKIHTKKSFSMF